MMHIYYNSATNYNLTKELYNSEFSEICQKGSFFLKMSERHYFFELELYFKNHFKIFLKLAHQLILKFLVKNMSEIELIFITLFYI